MSEIRIPFPLGGIVRRVAFQEQEIQTCYHATNVFPDTARGRARGGRRPGLTKRFATLLEDDPQFILDLVTVAGEPYRTLVAATTVNAYQSLATPSGVAGGITYTETLNALSGYLEANNGDPLETEVPEPLVVSEYNVGEVPRGEVTTYQGTLIIAGSGTVLSTSVGTIVDGRLSSTDVADWTALGIDLEVHSIQLNGDFNGVYQIQDVDTLNITIAGITGSGSVTYSVIEGPKILDFDNEILEQLIPTTGYVPTGARALTVYRERLVWAVGRAWYMSRVGDIYDYDYGADADDLGRAVSSVSSDSGQPGDPIIAMAAGGYDYLIMWGEDSTWVLRGDPVYGGQLYAIDKHIGCVDSSAWCRGESEEIFFLSKNGMYRLDANVDSGPQAISKPNIPRELQNAARDNYETTLVYDSEYEGIAIFITPKDSAEVIHWWFDTETQSFWKWRFQTGHQPISALGFSGNPTFKRKLVMLCKDGYIRELGGSDDDGTAISSEIVFGPYQLDDSRRVEGILNTLQVTLDTLSSDVTVEIYVDETAEQVVEAATAATSPAYSVTIGGGQSKVIRPRRRGGSMAIRIAATTDWAFEMMVGEVQKAGLKRYGD